MKATKHILVTGADGMGKTTLIKRLTETYGIHYIGHEGGPVQSQEDGLCRLAHTRAGPMGIQDRCCAIDDTIYSSAFDRNMFIKTEEYNEILRGWNPEIIFVKTSSAEISREVKAHKSPELLKGVIEKSDLIRVLYNARMSSLIRMGLKVYLYDWRRDIKAETLISSLTSSGVLSECAE